MNRFNKRNTQKHVKRGQTKHKHANRNNFKSFIELECMDVGLDH